MLRVPGIYAAERLPIERLTSGDADVDIAVAILRLDGTLAANGAIRATLRADAAVDGVNRVVVTVPFTELPEGTAEAGALADFVIAYDIQSTRTALSGRRSLYLSYPKTDVSVIAAAELKEGGQAAKWAGELLCVLREADEALAQKQWTEASLSL